MSTTRRRSGSRRSPASWRTLPSGRTRSGRRSWVASARDSTEQLKRLREQYGKTQVAVNDYKAEVARLQALLNFRSTLGQTKSVAGQVLEKSPTAYQNTITIDIGRSAGVAVNDPVSE